MRAKDFGSYDVRKLVSSCRTSKLVRPRVPVYSHQSYDVVADEFQEVGHPDIVIVEGLNMLQTGDGAAGKSPRVFVSDFFDFSIYIDADEADIERWYIDRFQMLRETVFKDPRSYFHRYASLTGPAALETARGIWREINGLNLAITFCPPVSARASYRKRAGSLVKRVR